MNYFSIEALVAVLRESIEAALIIGILLAYLNKTNNKKNRIDIWAGTVAALIVTLISGFLIWEIYDRIPETFAPFFEGTVMLVAAVILSTMIVWMYKHGRTIKAELEMKSEEALSKGSRLTLAAISFVSILREGIETILFLAAIRANGETNFAIITGTATGVVIAVLISLVMFKSMINFNIKMFFNVTSVFLVGLSFYLIRTGINEFQEAGALFGESSLGILLQVGVLGGYAIFLWKMFKKVNNDIHKSAPTAVPA